LWPEYIGIGITITSEKNAILFDRDSKLLSLFFPSGWSSSLDV
jgi:uncharacterized protein YbdZ (MbtH family)